MKSKNYWGLSAKELYLFNKGLSYHSYRFMGAHLWRHGDSSGVRFAVWAPNAVSARVIGDFNGWAGDGHEMTPIGKTGVYALFIAGIGREERYKFELVTAAGDTIRKADPYAVYSERRPGTASVVQSLSGYVWGDGSWQEAKRERSPYSNPLLVYEAHAGSWKTHGRELFYSYEQLADELVPYASEMGYTHIELMPLSEHPLDASWGYQITGFYSATSRYGTPQQLMALVDRCHQSGLGVILDWVPGHFCKDDHGLRKFDGSPLYEGYNPNRAELPLWGTLAFDFSRHEVVSFLLSNALFWMEQFHIDGLRVDAVANMIDLHMDRPPEMHTLNRLGGKENLDALRFLKKLNETVFHYYPDALMIAEDSSAWPAVTSPTYQGGLGFNFKWNMGWMNDALRYMELDPSLRPQHHEWLTFSIHYAFSENYVLPLSHDEVVHGKRSLLCKMPGSYEEKFDQLRLFYGYWMCHPGKKLLFMGGEWGQFDEWKDAGELDWSVLQYDSHRAMRHYVQTLNRLYRELPPLWERDRDPGCFEWIDVHNAEQSVISFIRRGNSGQLLVIINFSRQDYPDYRIGVPEPGQYRALIHSQDVRFGGRETGLEVCCNSDSMAWHGRSQSVSIDLPPFTFLILSPCAGDAH